MTTNEGKVKGHPGPTTCTLHAMMDAFLDDEIGESSKLLPDLLRGLRKKEDLLQGQVLETFSYMCSNTSLSIQWVCMQSAV